MAYLILEEENTENYLKYLYVRRACLIGDKYKIPMYAFILNKWRKIKYDTKNKVVYYSFFECYENLPSNSEEMKWNEYRSWFDRMPSFLKKKELIIVVSAEILFSNVSFKNSETKELINLEDGWVPASAEDYF